MSAGRTLEPLWCRVWACSRPAAPFLAAPEVHVYLLTGGSGASAGQSGQGAPRPPPSTHEQGPAFQGEDGCQQRARCSSQGREMVFVWFFSWDLPEGAQSVCAAGSAGDRPRAGSSRRLSGVAA